MKKTTIISAALALALCSCGTGNNQPQEQNQSKSEQPDTEVVEEVTSFAFDDLVSNEVDESGHGHGQWSWSKSVLKSKDIEV